MRTQCQIRVAAESDLDAVLSVLGQPRPRQRELAMWDRMMATDDLAGCLTERDGEAVGTATRLYMPNLTYDCRPTVFIEAVVVVEHQRRHKRHAADGALDFYRSLGFEPEAEGFRFYIDA